MLTPSARLQALEREHWFLEFFRGRPRGGDNFTSLFQVLQTLYSKRQKRPFLP